MSKIHSITERSGGISWFKDAQEYLIDRTQRTILFWDILRRRGNEYLAHIEAGQPPILVFDYEMVMDGRTFEQPVNYSLVRIMDRRNRNERGSEKEIQERRLTRDGKAISPDGKPSRPIVVIDPRAGHGPGIGGSKFNSQIGVALDYGHPVYFIMFYTNPEPGQTISHVQKAEVRFLEEVARRHPQAPKPAIIGNCQAGWAAALIGADRPDVTGPMVFTGSPLSYWGGVEGANPMRYKGGLCGGIWLTSLWCDLGNGHFDGAHLVAGFEDLNPANTLWTKLYHMFANIDSEEERFLNFEKWWGGFFKMNAEEIQFIVKSLFIGNELEQGNLMLDDGKVINLKNFRDPILAFASGGDNITPPPQAFNWIKKVYGTVEEIKRCGQVIIYMVHEKVGHLGIFVSGNVAKKEHRQILGTMGFLEYLAPGLYEMVVEGEPRQTGMDDYQVRFKAREMEDLLALDDGLEDEKAFIPVNAVSKFNDRMYRTFARPWVQMVVNEPVAELIRQLHPLRMQRYMISDRNPALWPVQWVAPQVSAQRRPVVKDNPYVALENLFSESIKAGLNYYRDVRDLYQEFWFKAVYANPWMKLMFGGDDEASEDARSRAEDEKTKQKREKSQILKSAATGGFVEACVRIIIAVAGADRVLDKREFQTAEKIIQENEQLCELPPDDYKKIAKAQARILDADPKQALAAIARMTLTPRDREEIYAIAQRMAYADDILAKREKKLLADIAEILKLD